MAKKMTVIQKALNDIEAAWNDITATPVKMSAEEFEKELLRQAKKHGTPYSTETGKWLAVAKRALKDPRISRGCKNLYLSEVDPPELKSSQKKFGRAMTRLETFAEWAYGDLINFLKSPGKDSRLKAYLRWRALPTAEAFNKYGAKNLKGREAKAFYLTMRPVVVFRKNNP